MSIILGIQTSKRLFRQSRRYCPSMPSKPLNFNDGPLVWIDCEMTGLDPSKDRIIEIAVRASSEQMDRDDVLMTWQGVDHER